MQLIGAITLNPENMKKIAKIVVAIMFAGVVISGLVYGQELIKTAMKINTYRKLHSVKVGTYYSVEQRREMDGSTFIIGQIVSPQIGGTVKTEGDLIQIEVPPKMADHPSGNYLTVTTDRFGQERTWYFTTAEAVVKHALEH